MHLSPRDLDVFTRVLPELYPLRTLDGFFEESAILLRELFRFDHGGWHVVSLHGPVVKTIVMQSELPITPQRVELVARALPDHPFTTFWQKATKPTALLFSDFPQRQRERHASDHRELYRELEIGDNMALPVGACPGEFCGLAFVNKRFGRFSERDREMLQLLRPHLAIAYANAQQFSSIVTTRAIGAESELTPREGEVAAWLASGKTNWEIAVICRSRVRTVEKHVERILRKLNVENRTAAAVAIREAGMLQIPPPSGSAAA